MDVFASDLLLEELQFEIHQELCLMLSRDNAWIIVADYLVDKGMYIDVESLTIQQNPAEHLIKLLKTRRCKINHLCHILRECRLFHALSVLQNPEPLSITLQPGDGKDNKFVELGGTLELECEAWSLPPPVYQWFKDNEPVAGANTNKLSVPDFNPSMEGHYFCRIRQDINEAQGVLSNDIAVKVAPIFPEIEREPEGVRKQEGESICLQIRADGYPQPDYLWYKGNMLVQKGNKPSLYINYASPEDSGIYKCLVTNTAGDVMSEAVSVQVIKKENFPKFSPEQRCTAKAKIALIIGNFKYESHDNLLKPIDDVHLLATKLDNAGFKVISLINLRKVEMFNVLHMFCEKLKQGVYGLFYFAGHGVQIDDNLRLMLPVDAPEKYSPSDCLSEKQVKDLMLSKNPTLRVIILDMCLRSPAIDTFSKHGKKVDESSYETLESPDVNLILVRSTSGNLSAYESRKEPNGTYIKFLSRYIEEEIPMPYMFLRVHEAINEAEKKRKVSVSRKQVPFLNTNADGNYCITDKVYGDPSIDQMFAQVFDLPESKELEFKPSVNIAPPKAHFSRHRDYLLNAMEIEIRGVDLDQYKLKLCSQKGILQMNDVPIKEVQENGVYRVVVEDLQGRAATGNLNFTVDLKDKEDRLISSAQLSVIEPLAAKWFLWIEREAL